MKGKNMKCCHCKEIIKTDMVISHSPNNSSYTPFNYQDIKYTYHYHCYRNLHD